MQLPSEPLIVCPILVRRHFSLLDAEDVADQLGETGPELMKLLPELQYLLPEVVPSPPSEPELEKRRLFNAVAT
jgi:hypothetical protein